MDNGAFSPCAFIPVRLPLDHLAPSDMIELTLANPAEALHYQADVMVCQRYSAMDLAEAERLIGHARRHGMQILYDLDDNLLDIPDQHPEASMLRQRAAIVDRFVPPILSWSRQNSFGQRSFPASRGSLWSRTALTNGCYRGERSRQCQSAPPCAFSTWGPPHMMRISPWSNQPLRAYKKNLAATFKSG